MSPTAKQLLAGAMFDTKTVIARHPLLALPIARHRHGVVFRPTSELVIEGFPRTGTSFAIAAFDLAQPSKVEVACHVHAPAQVMAAVKAGVPAMVVVRDPRETALSFSIRNPHLSLAHALRGYAGFYEPLLPSREGFLVARFEDITRDFGDVTRRLNERFHTSFAEFEHDGENVAKVFAAIDADYERRLSGEALERSVARPSDVRLRLKQQLEDRYAEPALARLRERAERAHELLSVV